MNTKKIIAGFGAVAIMIAAMLTSCQDTLEEQYINPEKTTEASIGKFFTTMLDNRRVRADYWNIRTFLVMHPGVYTNTVSYRNADRRYQQQLNYLDDFWKDYYTPNYYDQDRVTAGAGGMIAHMREIERQYALLSTEEQANADIFVHAARIVLYDQTAQMVDLFGDIPFSEAGKLNLTGKIVLPKFDSSEEIYRTLLDGLKESAAYFASATPSVQVANGFSIQDILFQGNLDQWHRYANSLRLRLLMHISFQNPGKAETDIMEMLNAPANYPLVDEAGYNVLLTPLTNYTDNMRNAVTELTSHIAPQFLVEEVLKPASDPRIRVLYDKNVTKAKVYNADYYSMPPNISSTEQGQNIADGKYAILDSSTFILNTAFPGIVITASEVNFLKAEAFERWGSTADAQVAYEKAVTQAVEFVFYLNKLGADFRGADPEPAVTPLEMTTLLNSPTVIYAGTKDQKLAKIGTQKWLSLGFMQSVEGWTEVRRTNYPVLTFVPDPGTEGAVMPPSRLVYPGTEKVYNAINFEAVAGKDVPTAKIFWDIQ
jgi:hypothetical protein